MNWAALISAEQASGGSRSKTSNDYSDPAKLSALHAIRAALDPKDPMNPARCSAPAVNLRQAFRPRRMRKSAFDSIPCFQPLTPAKFWQYDVTERRRTDLAAQTLESV